MSNFATKHTTALHVFTTCLFVLIALQFQPSWIYAQGDTTQSSISLDNQDSQDIAGNARELTDVAVVSINAKDGTKYNQMELLDGRYTSKLSIAGNAEIQIKAQEKIYGIYIIWDKPPGYWSLKAQEGVRTSQYLWGKNDYIHEYVELSNPSEAISVITSNKGATICEIQIFSKGTLPGDVQVWGPPYEDADMLLLSTHADDEHLFFGGTMPTYAGELDYKVQIAYLTNHWAEAYRPHELLNGLWAVGMSAYPIIGEFPDYYSDNLEHAKSLYDLDAVFAYEVGLLRRFKPEVVIGHDINGEYGHGVHMLNAWILQQAIHLASDETYLPEQVLAYGTFNVSKVYLHLYPENSVMMDWTIPLASFDGKTAFEMAQIGFAEHLSQQKWFSVRTTGVHDCRAFGLYYTCVGYDSGKGTPDFFENVKTFSDDPVQETATTSGGAVEPSQDESTTGEESGFAIFLNKAGKPALLFSGALFVLFMILVIWGRKRNKE